MVATVPILRTRRSPERFGGRRGLLPPIDPLAGRPVVAAALARAPQRFADLVVEPIRADEALALFIDAIAHAHQELARRLRIDLGE